MKNEKTRRVPTISQFDETESGAASLCMILAAYGKNVELSDMRKKCKVSRDGCRVENIMAAAEQYGLKAERACCDTKLKGIRLPVIVRLKQGHYQVIERIAPKGIIAVDPAAGRRCISRERFDEVFSGELVSFTLSDAFVPGGKPYRMRNTIKWLIRNWKGAYVYLCILCFCLNLVGMLIPGMTRLFVDYYLPSLKVTEVTAYFASFTGLLVLQGMLLFLKKHIDLKFQRLQSADLTGSVIRKLLKLPMGFFQTRSHSSVISQLTGIDAMTDFVSARLVPVVFGLVFSILYMILLFTYNVRVAVCSVGLILLVIFFLLLLVAMSRVSSFRTAQDQAAFYGSVTQTVRLFDTIKSVAQEDVAFAETMAKYSTLLSDRQKANSFLAFVQAVPVALPLLIQTVVMCVGGIEVVGNRMTLGAVLACQSLAMSIFAPVTQFVSEFAMLQFQEGHMRGLHGIMTEEADTRLEDALNRRDEEINNTARLQGEVEIRSVSFGYDDSLPPVVKDLSIKVPKGHCVAFAGSSGSGKSTVMKLLLGLYLPQKGEILLDGVQRDDLDRRAVAASMSVVSQTPFVFSGTVRDNITLFDRSISMEEVIWAAKEACVYDAIESHVGGFHAAINPTELSFSGGELQRIMIARALVRKPAILLMDEATSALDTVVEEEIMENIRALGITLIIVAHRLSTIRDSDEILVMKDGEIVERGRHEELMQIENGVYLHLIRSGEEPAA